jgi:hypothetical protein
MRNIFTDLHLTPEQRAAAPSLIRKHLLALPTDATELRD